MTSNIIARAWCEIYGHQERKGVTVCAWYAQMRALALQPVVAHIAHRRLNTLSNQRHIGIIQSWCSFRAAPIPHAQVSSLRVGNV